MSSRLQFDNIMKVLFVSQTFTGATLVSTELDFDIPRGFIVKIHKVIMEHVQIFEDFEGISVDKLARMLSALIKDPDDTSTIDFTSNVVDHDVLMNLDTEIIIVAGTAGDTGFLVKNNKSELNFAAEGLDVFTARNMRVNSDAFGTDAADITEASVSVKVHYTLEKISDEMIINLLDIL